jgi:cell division transport system permease protein
MSQTGKQSAKRSKPSYFMSILGVTLVLFIVGVLGWVVLNSRKLEQVPKAVHAVIAMARHQIRIAIVAR